MVELFQLNFIVLFVRINLIAYTVDLSESGELAVSECFLIVSVYRCVFISVCSCGVQ